MRGGTGVFFSKQKIIEDYNWPKDDWIRNVLGDIFGPNWQSKPSRAGACRFMIVCFVPKDILKPVDLRPNAKYVPWETCQDLVKSCPLECNDSQVFVGKD